MAPLNFECPAQLQVSLNIPIWRHEPGGPHIDGLTPPEPSGRPGTFTLLAGIFLTDQMAKDMSNLWVWPGSHHIASYLRSHGADAFFDIVHPTYPMEAPEQILWTSSRAKRVGSGTVQPTGNELMLGCVMDLDASERNLKGCCDGTARTG
jgi:hypothetical protein